MNLDIDFNLRKSFKEIIGVLEVAANSAIKNTPLVIRSSHSLGHKTISEIGGRIIEEYLVDTFDNSATNNSTFSFQATSSRSLGDFAIESCSDKKHKFYFDVKAQHLSIREKTLEMYKSRMINAKKPGESHPNLISYQKVKDFYFDNERINEDIAFLMIHYDPIIRGGEVDFNIKLLTANSFFLLRDLATENLSFGNLGKGQIQLKRINSVKIQKRSKSEFVEVIDSLAIGKRASRSSSRA